LSLPGRCFSLLSGLDLVALSHYLFQARHFVRYGI
jgi:hypothetical protein